MFRIPVGLEFFDEIRQENACYIDKTELIYELLTETANKVTLFTRPRRFGKTLMMSMIESFFDITRDSRALFEGLNITRHRDFCEKWMNQYPVVLVSLKDVDSSDFTLAFRKLANTIADLCKKMPYLAESERVAPADKEIFERLSYGRGDSADVQAAFLTLTRMLNAHFDRKAILLIDEYDVPLARAHENGYYHQMLEVLRGMMSAGFKTNPFLQFAVLTGCLRVAQESIFTGTNNFKAYSVLDDRFGQYFGFTRDEVDKILQLAGIPEQSGIIRDWYDGYTFGTHRVFCPWDAANYVEDYLGRESGLPRNYWANTSHNDTIRAFVGDESLKSVPGKFEILLNGGTIRQTLVDDLTYEVLEPRALDSPAALRRREDSFWSLLVMAGYLTKADPAQKGGTVDLKIPNREIEAIFQSAVVDQFIVTLDRGRLHDLMESLWAGDDEAASRSLSDLLWRTISYNNYHEDYYHAFLAGIFAGYGYSPESDKERGLGRPDIELKDRDRRRALIIETKKADSEGAMEGACDRGLQQIAERRYAEDSGLRGYRVLRCGIAFFEKMARVKSLSTK